MTAAEAIREDERRAARDSYRAAGGSQRRALKSFMTQDEKTEARKAHAARIHLAVDALRDDPCGVEAWLEALDLNPHLSAMNAALVALQSPGEIVASSAGWRRQGYKVRKGEHAAGRITAPGSGRSPTSPPSRRTPATSHCSSRRLVALWWSRR